MKRHAGYVMKAVVLLLLQASLVDMLSLKGIAPDLLLIFIVYLAVREGQMYVLPWGFALGLILDLSTGTVIGLSALSKSAAAFTAGYFYSDNMISMTLSTYRFLLLVFLTAVVHNVIYFSIFTMGSEIGFFNAVFGLGLASALFTTTVAVLPMLVAARGEVVAVNSRKNFFYGIVLLVALVYLFRLVQLQVVYEDEYGKKSAENSLRPIVQNPLRGYVYDRRGELIVDNRPSYTVTVTPSEFDRSNLEYLAGVLKTDTALIAERIHRGAVVNRFAPTRVMRDVDFSTLTFIEEHADRLPGVGLIVESKRNYPTGAKAAHLFGYTTEVSDAKLQENPEDYKPGDQIGVSGLEEEYERYLRGKKGYSFITVNARGESQGRYNNGASDIPVTEGDDLYLNIDARTQAVAESLMADQRGAVVAIDPKTGGVIAIVSKPDYDLSLFGGVTPADLWTALNQDPAKPLFNRATQTRYPPGSTIKMMLAAAALEEHVVPPGWAVNCTGVFQFGTRGFKDVHVHGYTGFTESIQKSCNVFYYQLMLKVGLDRWTRFGREFGFGRPTGIDIGKENSGLLPSTEYFDRVYGKGRWTQGYLVSLAIGQGELGVSPVQMASYVAAIATRGDWHTPTVVAKVRRKETGEWIENQVQTRRIELSPNVWDTIQEGMVMCVNSPGGTASLARVPNVTVAGKTGTSQNPHGKDHAWFVGYAPADDPKIAIAVLVENTGYGGVFAAPIASRCIEQFLSGGVTRPLVPDTTVVAVLPTGAIGD